MNKYQFKSNLMKWSAWVLVQRVAREVEGLDGRVEGEKKERDRNVVKRKKRKKKQT